MKTLKNIDARTRLKSLNFVTECVDCEGCGEKINFGTTVQNMKIRPKLLFWFVRSFCVGFSVALVSLGILIFLGNADANSIQDFWDVDAIETYLPNFLHVDGPISSDAVIAAILQLIQIFNLFLCFYLTITLFYGLLTVLFVAYCLVFPNSKIAKNPKTAGRIVSSMILLLEFLKFNFRSVETRGFGPKIVQITEIESALFTCTHFCPACGKEEVNVPSRFLELSRGSPTTSAEIENFGD